MKATACCFLSAQGTSSLGLWLLSGASMTRTVSGVLLGACGVAAVSRRGRGCWSWSGDGGYIVSVGSGSELSVSGTWLVHLIAVAS